tara:strand:+ start:13082 stop:14935 length:1854 start_codon:yes stop_codon:yes gene_type:complete
MAAVEGLKETGDAVEDLAGKTRKVGNETKKDWGGVTDMFSSLLPRGMQRTVRGFKSTTRATKRLSRSFKLLKSAWVAFGIGAVIIAIELLVANWEKVTDALNGITPAQKKAAEDQKKLTKEIASTKTELEGYVKIVKSATTDEVTRIHALNKLAKAMGEVRDLDLTDANAQKEVTEAYDRHLEKQKLLINHKQTQELLAEKILLREQGAFDLNDKQLVIYRKLIISDGQRLADRRKMTMEVQNENAILMQIDVLHARQKRRADAIAKIESEVNAILSKQAKERKKIEKSEKDRLEAERNAEKLRADAKRKREDDAKFIADLEKRLSEEIMLAAIEDEQERAEKELSIRQEEERIKVADAGATAEQLELLATTHEMALADLRKGFRDDTAEDTLADEIALEDELFRLKMTDEERAIQAVQDTYEKRLELAGENAELVAEATKLAEDEITQITNDAADEREAVRQKESDDAIALTWKGQKAVLGATSQMFGQMSSMSKENSEQQKVFAITDILLSQAVSVAQAIKNATKSSATVWDMAANIAIAITSVLSAFAGVKSILAQAGASDGDIGGGGMAATSPLVPQNLGRQGTEAPSQVYVVQSQLEGMNMQAQEMDRQVVL